MKFENTNEKINSKVLYDTQKELKNDQISNIDN